jgi:hypothetical protein
VSIYGGEGGEKGVGQNKLEYRGYRDQIYSRKQLFETEGCPTIKVKGSANPRRTAGVESLGECEKEKWVESKVVHDRIVEDSAHKK